MYISCKKYSQKSRELAICRGILPKKLLSAMLMLALVFSSLAVSPNFNLTASADTSDYWNAQENGKYKYADFSPFASDSGKNGSSKENAYEISKAAQLAALAILVNEYAAGTAGKTVTDATGENNTAKCSNFQGKYIKLTADIDLSKDGNAVEWVPIGRGIDTDKFTDTFQGNFDGQGHTISNMHIGSAGNPNATYTYAGLFGYVYAASSNNASIQNVNIDAGSYIYSSGDYVGGICGYLSGSAIVINCYNSGTVSSTYQDSTSSKSLYADAPVTGWGQPNYEDQVTVYLGGICGYLSGSAKVNNCYNNGTVSSTYQTSTNSNTLDADVPVTSGGPNHGRPQNNQVTVYLGGICGYLSDSAIVINCYNSGTVSSTYQDSTSSKSLYADAPVTGWGQPNYEDQVTVYLGEICGYDGTISEGEVINCYYNKDTKNKGIGKQEDVAGKTTALPEDQMKAAAGADENSDCIEVNGTNYYALVDALNAGADAYNAGSPDIQALSWAVKKDNNNYGYPEFAYIIRLQTVLGYKLKISANTDYHTIIIEDTDYAYVTIREVKSGKLDDLFGLESLGDIDDQEYNENGEDFTNLIDKDNLSWNIDLKNSEKITKTDYIITNKIKTTALVITPDYKADDGDGYSDTSFKDNGSNDEYHIIEVVDSGTLYVAVYKTTVAEGTTEHEIAFKITPQDTSKFLCWVGNVDLDDDLEVLSYRDNYYFYVRSDRTIIAVYADDDVAKNIDALKDKPASTTDACANIESVDRVETETGFKVISVCSVPHTQNDDKENYIIDFAGLLATKSENIGKSDSDFKSIEKQNNGSISNAGERILVRGYNSEAHNAQYTWRRITTNISPDETWYVRAYLVYRENNNADAVTKYKYGEIFKIEFNSDTVSWTSVSAEVSAEGGSDQ